MKLLNIAALLCLFISGFFFGSYYRQSEYKTVVPKEQYNIVVGVAKAAINLSNECNAELNSLTEKLERQFKPKKRERFIEI